MRKNGKWQKKPSQVCAKRRKLREAEELVEAGEANAVSFAILANVHATCGSADGAVGALDRMEARGFSPSVFIYVGSNSTI